jgi:hypothetical protein
MNPCPCRYYGDPIQEYTCRNATVSRYQAGKRHPADLGAIAGPRLCPAQVDIHIEVLRVEYEKLSDDRLGEPSAAIRERVEAARARPSGCWRACRRWQKPALLAERAGSDTCTCSAGASGRQRPGGTRMSVRAYHGKTPCVFLSNASRVACILKLAWTMARKAGLGPGRQRRDPDDALGGGDSVSAEKANLTCKGCMRYLRAAANPTYHVPASTVLYRSSHYGTMVEGRGRFSRQSRV